MKILFITYHFPPYNCMGAVRTGKTAKYLIDMGYDVKIITAKDQKLPLDLKLEIDKDKIFYTDWIDVNTPIYKVLGDKQADEFKQNLNTDSFKSKLIQKLKNLYVSLFHVPDQYIGWYYFAYRESIKLISSGWKADIIYSSATPYTSHLIASKVSKKFSIPWIAEFRDLWSDNHYRNTNILDRWLENNTMKQSAALIGVTELFVDKLKKKHNKPTYLIRNGFDTEDYLSNEKNEDEKIKIVHTGSLYEGKRDPTLLLKLISNDKELQNSIIIEFYGSKLNWLKEKIEKYRIEDNVKVYAPINRKKSLAIQSTADILLLLTWDNPNETGILPGKLFEYIGANKPILSMGAINNEASNLIKENKFGLVSNNEEEIKNFILKIRQSNYIDKYKISGDKFNRKKQIENLIKIFETYI